MSGNLCLIVCGLCVFCFAFVLCRFVVFCVLCDLCVWFVCVFCVSKDFLCCVGSFMFLCVWCLFV